jgi:hypothetical protein
MVAFSISLASLSIPIVYLYEYCSLRVPDYILLTPSGNRAYAVLCETNCWPAVLSLDPSKQSSNSGPDQTARFLKSVYSYFLVEMCIEGPREHDFRRTPHQ